MPPLQRWQSASAGTRSHGESIAIFDRAALIGVFKITVYNIVYNAICFGKLQSFESAKTAAHQKMPAPIDGAISGRIR
jgi:hypothetical protein